jgi:hypothetical protein
MVVFLHRKIEIMKDAFFYIKRVLYKVLRQKVSHHSKLITRLSQIYEHVIPLTDPNPTNLIG